MGRLWESHFQTRFALIGYAGAPRGVLRWGLDNAPTASNCKPKVKSAFPQIFRNICFLATFLLVNQFAKIFMNSKLQGHGYSQMLTYDNTTKYSPQMFSQYLACSRLNEKKKTLQQWLAFSIMDSTGKLLVRRLAGVWQGLPRLPCALRVLVRVQTLQRP